MVVLREIGMPEQLFSNAIGTKVICNIVIKGVIQEPHEATNEEKLFLLDETTRAQPPLLCADQNVKDKGERSSVQ